MGLNDDPLMVFEVQAGYINSFDPSLRTWYTTGLEQV